MKTDNGTLAWDKQGGKDKEVCRNSDVTETFCEQRVEKTQYLHEQKLISVVESMRFESHSCYTCLATD